MSTSRQLLKSAFTMVLPKSWLLVRGPTNASNSGPPAIALTIDDGPHPEHTPRLLDRLAATRARGTFFVIGEKAQQHPNLIRRIVTAATQPLKTMILLGINAGLGNSDIGQLPIFAGKALATPDV